jgi:hypothetical protein
MATTAGNVALATTTSPGMSAAVVAAQPVVIFNGPPSGTDASTQAPAQQSIQWPKCS